MKHQTPDSMKFRKLQRRLGVGKAVVAGTLELLWIATQKNTPQGDIGKFSNEEIAIECDWDGCPDELVAALAECGWLDYSDEHRLVVHDWEEHAPGWVHRQLKRHQKLFVTVSSGKSVTDNGLETTNGAPSVTHDGLDATPNLTKPNQTKPKKKRAPFVRPTAADIQQYGDDSGYQIDASAFLDYYDANGWKVGRNAMKDWKAAVRNWHKRQGQFTRGSPQRSGVSRTEQTINELFRDDHGNEACSGEMDSGAVRRLGSPTG